MENKKPDFSEGSSQIGYFGFQNKLFFVCISPVKVKVFFCLAFFINLDNNESENKILKTRFFFIVENSMKQFPE